MSIIVEHGQTGRLYIIVGTRFGNHPSHVIGRETCVQSPPDRRRQNGLLAVTDPAGDIRWIQTDELRVVSIYGQSLEQLLAGHPKHRSEEKSVAGRSDKRRCCTNDRNR